MHSIFYFLIVIGYWIFKYSCTSLVSISVIYLVASYLGVFIQFYNILTRFNKTKSKTERRQKKAVDRSHFGGKPAAPAIPGKQTDIDHPCASANQTVGRTNHKYQIFEIVTISTRKLLNMHPLKRPAEEPSIKSLIDEQQEPLAFISPTHFKGIALDVTPVFPSAHFSRLRISILARARIHLISLILLEKHLSKRVRHHGLTLCHVLLSGQKPDRTKYCNISVYLCHVLKQEQDTKYRLTPNLPDTFFLNIQYTK